MDTPLLQLPSCVPPATHQPNLLTPGLGRADTQVTDSRGKLRWGTAGGRTRALFHSLPGVGQRTAKL